MDTKKLFDDLLDMQRSFQTNLAQLEIFKEELVDLLEKDASLEIENQHLREELSKLREAEEPEARGQRLSKSRATLEKLYEDGFHVCNEDFGKHREDGEPCVFCTDVIYGER